MSLLSVRNITKTFPVESGVLRRKIGFIRALNNVSFSIHPGSVLGVVGESGSGKTTLGKAVCRFFKLDSGRVFIEDRNIDLYSRLELSSKVQMIFQDPFASLNPKLTIGTIIEEASDVEGKKEREKLIKDTLGMVGLPSNILLSYPHQFSGGQRQRIALARALVKKPKIVIADEPLSSLDISIQNQLLNLFMKLKEKHLVSFIFISHDLVTTSNLADYLIVMKDGEIVEEGPTETIILFPQNSYTRNLISAVPDIK
ncbi:MAG: ABC transporter ATP-binding protein [Endomicrobiales bacterium]|nr:ABC transporter ATP-binding protein [Endomicrobiales bacterium]